MPSEHFLPFFKALTATSNPVTFIQIGANDGIWNDPIEPFIRSGNWRGILVEPIPHIFARLQARYAYRTDLVLENCAIADADGERTFYSVHELEGVENQYASAVSSFSLAHVLRHTGQIPNLTKRIQVIHVPCLTLRTLLAKHGIAQLDALVMDAEGFDGAIVQNIPFDVLHPALIFYEHKHLNTDTRAACRNLLTQHDYQLLERHSNTLAFLKQLCVEHSAFAHAWAHAQPINTAAEKISRVQ